MLLSQSTTAAQARLLAGEAAPGQAAPSALPSLLLRAAGHRLAAALALRPAVAPMLESICAGLALRFLCLLAACEGARWHADIFMCWAPCTGAKACCCVLQTEVYSWACTACLHWFADSPLC